MLLSDSTGNVFLSSARPGQGEIAPGQDYLPAGESGFAAPTAQAMTQSVFCTPPLRGK